jgi:hypothetical protein
MGRASRALDRGLVPPHAGRPARGPRAGWSLWLSLAAAGLVPVIPGCRRSRPVLQRGDAAVIVLAAPVPVPAGLQAISEREPASAGEGPMVLPLTPGPGLAVVGTLSHPGDSATADSEDLFAIDGPRLPAPPDVFPATSDTAPAGDSTRALSLEVHPAETLATRLELREAGGPVLGSSSGAPGQRHGLPNMVMFPGGRYVIALRPDARGRAAAPRAGARPSGSYVLVVRESALGAGDEREPNDSIETATLFGPAHVSPEMAGYFATPRDRDFYRIPIGEASESTVLSVFLTPPSSVAPTLTVFDRNGGKLQSARGYPGERIVLHALAPAALSPPAAVPVPGYFYVLAQPQTGSNLEHRYVLGVRSEPWPGGEREPNDQPVRASVLGPGSTSGFLGPTDVDFFRCEVAAGDGVVLELIPPKRADVVLELLLPGAARPQRADAVRRGQSERLTAAVATGGSALIRVQGRRATDYDFEEAYTGTMELRPGPPAGPVPGENRSP